MIVSSAFNRICEKFNKEGDKKIYVEKKLCDEIQYLFMKMFLANRVCQLSQYDISYFEPSLIFSGETLKAFKLR